MSINEKKIGVALAYAAQAVSVLTGLLYTPVMLRLLGQSEYGLYQLVASVVSYLSLFSLGFSASYNRFYAPLKIEEDDKEISKLNGMFLLVFSALASACFACGVILTMKLKFALGSGLSNEELATAKMLFLVMVINMTITIFNTVFECYITAHERFIFQKMLMLIRNIANPFLCLPLLLLGYGSIGMVTISLTLTVIVTTLNILFCFKKLKMRFCVKNLDIEKLKSMSRFTVFIFFNQIIDQVNWTTDKFLLGRLINTNAVAVYGVASTLNSQYISFSSAISNVFTPKVNMIVAKGNFKLGLDELFIKIGRIQYMLLMLILSGFFFFGRPFIILWAGKEYIEAYYTGLILMIPVTIPIIQNIGIEIQRAMNKHQARSIVYSVIAISNIIISIFLIKMFGVSGAAMGTALSLFCGNGLFMNWYYWKKLNIDILTFWKNIFKISISIIPAFVCGLVLCKLFEINNFIGLLICVTIYAVVYMVCLLLWGMNPYEKGIIKSILKRRR